jgi:acyl carrier protein
VTTTDKTSARAIQRWLVTHIAELLGEDPASIDVREPFVNYGLGSTDAVILSGDLEAWLGYDMPATLLWDFPTVEALALHLVTSPADAAA